jgi:hypothetical protein
MIPESFTENTLSEHYTEDFEESGSRAKKTPS